MDWKCIPLTVNSFRQSATQGQIVFKGAVEKGIDPAAHYRSVIRPALIANDVMEGLVPLPNERAVIELNAGTIDATINFGVPKG